MSDVGLRTLYFYTMQKSPLAIFLIAITFLITLGLAISLQGVLGINIGNVLNLGGNKITNVGTPTDVGDVTTRGWVESAVGKEGFINITYSNCPNAIAGCGGAVCGITYCLPFVCSAVSPGQCNPIGNFPGRPSCFYYGPKCLSGYTLFPLHTLSPGFPGSCNQQTGDVFVCVKE